MKPQFFLFCGGLTYKNDLLLSVLMLSLPTYMLSCKFKLLISNTVEVEFVYHLNHFNG